MGKKLLKIIQLFFFILLLYLLLTKPTLTLSYASKGLAIWYTKMVPSLFPMMLVTGCMIKLNTTSSFSLLIHPIIKRFFHTSRNGTYSLIMGFLCGFPMGAKIICELYMQNKLSKKEAQALLPVCNNIGPIFMLTYGLLSFNTTNTYSTLILFYCIPLIFAICVQRKYFFKEPLSVTDKIIPSFSIALDESISESAIGMLSLGGYLMFFNILLLIPIELIPLNPKLSSLTVCLIEITNGLSYPTVLPNYFYLSLLQFGGLCCCFQTLKYTQKTDLSFKKYIIHKILLTGITFIFFFLHSFVVSYVGYA